MTKESLQARILQYQKDIETLNAQVTQLTANIQATQGAIQDAEYWITQLPASAEVAASA